MSNIIYSKKFPKEMFEKYDRFDVSVKDAAEAGKSQSAPPKATGKDYLAEIEKNITYEDLPERRGKSKEFIVRAICASNSWRFDIEIQELPYCIIVDLSFDGSRPLGSDVKELIEMADDLEIFLNARNRDVTLNLLFYTKAVYQRGRLMFP